MIWHFFMKLVKVMFGPLRLQSKYIVIKYIMFEKHLVLNMINYIAL